MDVVLSPDAGLAQRADALAAATPDLVRAVRRAWAEDFHRWELPMIACGRARQRHGLELRSGEAQRIVRLALAAGPLHADAPDGA